MLLCGLSHTRLPCELPAPLPPASAAQPSCVGDVRGVAAADTLWRAPAGHAALRAGRQLARGRGHRPQHLCHLHAAQVCACVPASAQLCPLVCCSRRTATCCHSVNPAAAHLHQRCLTCRWDELMDVPEGADAAAVGIGQWVPGISFGHFTERTMQKTYSSNSTVPVHVQANGTA